MGNLILKAEEIKDLRARMDQLIKKGVRISATASGETNFSGCRSGYCQAWD